MRWRDGRIARRIYFDLPDQISRARPAQVDQPK